MTGRTALLGTSARVRRGSVAGSSVVAFCVASATFAEQVVFELGTSGMDGHFQITTGVAGSIQDISAGTPFFGDFYDPGPDQGGFNPPEPSGTSVTWGGSFLVHVDALPGNKISLTDPIAVGGGGVGDYFNTAPAGVGGPSEMQMEVLNEGTGVPGPTTASTSQFRTQGGCVPFVGCETNLLFDLVQSIAETEPGPNGEIGAYIDQMMTITNEDDVDHTIVLMRHLVMDMPYFQTGISYWLDDGVGVDFGLNGYPIVYAQDASLNTAALILSTTVDPSTIDGTDDFYYYATKGVGTGNGCGIEQPPPHPTLPPGPDCPGDPGCANTSGLLCPPYDYGSDYDYWDRPGVPNCWKNWIPGVGRDIPGQSPEGGTCDASIGLQIELTLPAGGTYGPVTFRTSYGFRPIPPQFGAPTSAVQLVEYDADTGCAEFFYTVSNNNPGLDDLQSIYMDVEAGQADASAVDCRADLVNNVTPPPGYEVVACTDFDGNGHALVQMDLIDPDGPFGISAGGDPGVGRLTINTNGLDGYTNPETNVSVPPLGVVVSFAQDHPDRGDFWAEPTCGTFDFGPAAGNGLWSIQSTVAAPLPVPSLTAWARSGLALLLVVAGFSLLIRRRPMGSGR